MSKKPAVLALVAHPDDIEFTMIGTMLMLKKHGWEMHYMTIANGCCGTATETAEATAATRAKECQDACRLAGAIWHPSVCNDLEIFHNWDIISRVLGVIREVQPSIVLTQAPEGMLNAPCNPKLPPYQDDIVVYHSVPHGLMDPFRRKVEPEIFVNVEPVFQMKWDMLTCHKSQKEWLDVSQGMDAYQKTMQEFMAELGSRSGKFKYAEGFRRRNWLGLSSKEWDPLTEILGDDVLANPLYK